MINQRIQTKIPENHQIVVNVATTENANVQVRNKPYVARVLENTGETLRIEIEGGQAGEKITLLVTDEEDAQQIRGVPTPATRSTQVIAKKKERNSEIKFKIRKVLSLSIPDMSAFRVLKYLEANEDADIYTGTFIGGFLSLLLAMGIRPSQLMAALLENADLFSAEGASFSELIRRKDARKSLCKFEKFIEHLVPNLHQWEIQYLKKDVFFPVMNGKTGSRCNISKKETPRLPLITAFQAILASFVDTEPLVLDKKAVSDAKELDVGRPFTEAGVIWQMSNAGKASTDMALTEKYEFQNLSFRTFGTKYLYTEFSQAQLTDHTKPNAYIQANEVALNLDIEDTVSYCEGYAAHLQNFEYDYTILPKQHYQMSVSKKQLENFFNSSGELLKINLVD